MIKGMFGEFGGYKIFSDPNVTQKVIKKWCRSKKKRIRKKWANNPKNYHVVPGGAIVFGNNILVHPSSYEQIKKELTPSEG